MKKRWMLAVLISFLVLLFACAAVVFVADPFQHYRLASWFTPAYDNGEEAYYNAGLARYSDYDAVLLGTSMVENTKTSQIDALFGTNSIKLPFEGGMATNHAKVLRIAFDTHQLSDVFYGMDMYSFVRDPEYSKFQMPRYLYDNNPFNDVFYLLNGDVLLHRLPAILYHQQAGDAPEPTTRDTMYTWGKPEDFSEESTLGSYDFSQPAQEMLESEAFAANVAANFERYIKPFLDEHPDTTFTFFFPPYSSLEWYRFQQVGHLDAILYTKEQLAELLLEYPNARLYDFTANLDWIEDLSLYTDHSHHSPQVNEWIVEELAGDAFLVQDIYTIYENNDALMDVIDNFPVPGQ